MSKFIKVDSVNDDLVIHYENQVVVLPHSKFISSSFKYDIDFENRFFRIFGVQSADTKVIYTETASMVIQHLINFNRVCY